MTEVVRPPFVKDKHLIYLDALRETGGTNMYGAPPYLQRDFRMSRDRAVQTTVYWMSTFTQRHPKLTKKV